MVTIHSKARPAEAYERIPPVQFVSRPMVTCLRAFDGSAAKPQRLSNSNPANLDDLAVRLAAGNMAWLASMNQGEGESRNAQT